MQIKKLLFSYYSWLTYYLSYYFGNIAYPIIYPIITFTYRKVKFYPINNSSWDNMAETSLLTELCLFSGDFFLEMLLCLVIVLHRLKENIDDWNNVNSYDFGVETVKVEHVFCWQQFDFLGLFICRYFIS